MTIDDLSGIKLIIFDADGTLRRTTVEGQPCPNKDGEWELMPGVKERLAEFDWGSPADGKTACGIVSNQAGVALGYLAAEMAGRLLYKMFVKAFGFNPYPGDILMCIHAPDEGCRCRKPAPGLLEDLMDMYGVQPQETLFVGDMDSDCEAATNAGCRFMWAKDFFGW